MLRAYEAFLAKKGTVKTQYVPFYQKWVSDCYAFLNEPLSNRLKSEQIKEFLPHMSKRQEEWQVKQADTALRLEDSDNKIIPGKRVEKKPAVPSGLSRPRFHGDTF